MRCMEGVKLSRSNQKTEQRAAIRRLLKRWGAATQLCKSKQEEIAQYQGLIDATYDLHPQQYTGMPHGNNISNPTALTAERAEELRNAYRRRIDDIMDDIAELMDFCAAIDCIIVDLPPDQQRVIDLRYRRMNSARKSPWARVGVLAGVSEEHARRLERCAIDKLIEYVEIKI